MKAYRLTINLTPSDKKTGFGWSEHDEACAARFGVLGFKLEKRVDNKWEEIDRCFGFPPAWEVNDLLEVAEPRDGTRAEWREVAEEEIEVVDSRPDALWQFHAEAQSKPAKLDKKTTMNDDEFDEFLNDATHAVADLWAEVSGQTLTNAKNELYDLNDLLTAFFEGKRPPDSDVSE